MKFVDVKLSFEDAIKMDVFVRSLYRVPAKAVLDVLLDKQRCSAHICISLHIRTGFYKSRNPEI